MREEDTVCVGSDGLQYCKVCGEAKEAFFPEGGFMGMKKPRGNRQRSTLRNGKQDAGSRDSGTSASRCTDDKKRL